jgi:hypothetical protein
MEYNLIDAYQTLEAANKNPAEWRTCPVCHAKPKVWIFNNGRSAACKCFAKYEKKIEAISLGGYFMQHKSFNGYPEELLKENWNKHVVRVRRKKIIAFFTAKEPLDSNILPF